MSIPKEPRQIMINLMYLVLTALLALNVSNEILNAFKTLSNSIDKSNQSITQNTDELYKAIQEGEKEKGQYDKVHKYRLQADDVVAKSDSMIAYLNNWKKRIIMEAGGYDKEEKNLPANLSNIDATTKLLVEEKGGDTLKKRILDLRQFLLSSVPLDSAGFSPLMPLNIQPVKKSDNNPHADWNMENFEHMPSIAALALFSKFQNDVRSSEAIVIRRLAELAHTKELKFDTLVAIAIPKSTYLLQGDKLEANILLAAFNKANKPDIHVAQGGGSAKPVENGVIPWETTVTGTGMQTVAGTLTYQAPGQDPKSYPWKFEYMVGSTGASLQLDKMNVFYIGVDNPVTVSAAGYSVEDVTIELPAGATQTGSNGHYTIKVAAPNPNFTVNIMAKPKSGGAPVKVSSMPIRIKRIPDPVATVLGKNQGNISAALLREAIAPAAKLDNFDFDAKFVVREFTFAMTPKGQDFVGPFTVKGGVAGTRFADNPDVAKALSRCKAGDKVFIEGIKAVGPDGSTRTLNPIIFSLN